MNTTIQIEDKALANIQNHYPYLRKCTRCEAYDEPGANLIMCRDCATAPPTAPVALPWPGEAWLRQQVTAWFETDDPTMTGAAILRAATSLVAHLHNNWAAACQLQREAGPEPPSKAEPEKYDHGDHHENCRLVFDGAVCFEEYHHNLPKHPHCASHNICQEFTHGSWHCWMCQRDEVAPEPEPPKGHVSNRIGHRHCATHLVCKVFAHGQWLCWVCLRDRPDATPVVHLS